MHPNHSPFSCGPPFCDGPHQPPCSCPTPTEALEHRVASLERALGARVCGRVVWPKPEPCGPPSDPERCHIYRAPHREACDCRVYSSVLNDTLTRLAEALKARDELAASLKVQHQVTDYWRTCAHDLEAGLRKRK